VLTEEPSVGIVGARLMEPDGRTLQHAGGVVHANGLTSHLGRGVVDAEAYHERAEVDYVTGALCAFRAGTWARFGPLDELYHPAYYEDLDFCLRLRRAGLRVVYEPGARAIHHEASSTGRESPLFLSYYHRNRMRFLARHLLRRGNRRRVLHAELAWLAKQRRLADLKPLVGAYARLPSELWALRGRAARRLR
jgi:GT2 family glycosyltransferase